MSALTTARRSLLKLEKHSTSAFLFSGGKMMGLAVEYQGELVAQSSVG